MKIDSQCIHAGYEPKKGEPRAVPIIQSTTFSWDSAESIGKLFDLEEAGFFYTRLANPTVDALEKKIAALEGGVGALCTSSGQAAHLTAIATLMQNGGHIISSSSIYGGTFNLFAVTLKKMGLEVSFVDAKDSEQKLDSYVRDNTIAVFGETIANPALEVLDIERMAKFAHRHNLPLIVDNTFATPILCRPFEFGADIVTHSTTKYMDGHAVQMGGVIVDSGNFDWTNGRFPEFTEPDPSYHGMIYTKTFAKAAYIVKARVQIMRDLGCCQTAQGAFYTIQGLETLHLRMPRHWSNAQGIAELLATHPKVASIKYPGLPSDPSHTLAKKYLLNANGGGVLSFELKGGREAGVKFINSLNMVARQVHVADAKTCVLHPASSTHRQMTDQQLLEAGISAGLIRLSVGIEAIDDLKADILQALDKA